MIAPSFESHQCLVGMWKRQLSCHAGHQEVGRCRTSGESQGMCNVTCTSLLSSNKAEPTLALKPRGDITRSPKQGYQWPHKKHSCPPKILKKRRVYGGPVADPQKQGIPGYRFIKLKETCMKLRKNMVLGMLGVAPRLINARGRGVRHDHSQKGVFIIITLVYTKLSDLTE